MRNGLFVVFDGIDGAGKTTQANLLLSALTRSGIECVLSKEPTDGEFGRKMRSSATTGRLSLDEELQNFIEDRKEHVRDLILPSLQADKVVILDRYYYSTIAYQGAISKEFQSIKDLVKESAIVPDVTFILDLDVPLSLFRIRNTRGDIPNEFEKEENLKRVHRIFRKLITTEEEVVKIEAQNTISLIHDQVLRTVRERLKKPLCAKGYDSDCGFCTPRITGQCEWYETVGKIKSAAEG
jgi:dTMP kinase